MTRGARLALGVPLLALALLWTGVRRWVELRPAAPLAPATRAAVMHAMRLALDGGEGFAPAGADLDRRSVGPVWVAAYRAGAPAILAQCSATTVGAALGDCARQLAEEARRLGWGAADRAAARLKVDVTSAEGPLPTWPSAALAMGVVPGVDGIGVRLGGREARLLPDDLLRADLLNGYRPFGRFAEVRAGLHVPRVVTVLARRLEVTGATWARSGKRFFRFRTDAFIEPAAPGGGSPAPVVRGVPSREPRLDRDALRAAALAAARYLLRHQHADGSFTYVYETTHDAALTVDYSLPRHFGAAGFLAEVHGATRDPAVGEGVRRALAYAARHTHPGCSDPEVACIASADADTADLGSTALALVAVAEHRRHGDDASLDALGRRLAGFLLRVQQPAGDFAHAYRLRERRPDASAKLLYYDGEATLALAKAHAVYGDPRYLEAARRGLDWLTKTQYRHFAGRFYFGEDHWTCLAAGAAWPRLRDPGYARFCRDYGVFLRRQQFRPGEHPEELRGAYGFTPFLQPHNTPSGSRTEAMLSAYQLSRQHGRPDERIRGQILEALRFLLQHQLRADDCYLCADPSRAAGGFLESPVARHVRIDFVQHAGSALLRAADIL